MAPDLKATRPEYFSWPSTSLKDIVDELLAKGFTSEQIYLIGFSPRELACHLNFQRALAKRYGGIIAFMWAA